eukprot:6841182-Ditylum_brightwellii.AAC.1
MTRYKTESAKTILSNFLRPASEMTRKILEHNYTSENAINASVANFALAEFVANHYDSVEARIKSHEWKVAGIAAGERREELNKCTELYREARKKAIEAESALKSKRNGKGKQRKSVDNLAEILETRKKEFHDIHIHLRTLEREVDMDTKERSAVERSISQFLILAIESYGAALSICNAGDQVGDISKHVFRMISLWFSNCLKINTEVNINAAMEKFAKTMPTYRFVPLIYQIFSRIDNEETNQTSSQPNTKKNGIDFQNALRSL